MRLSIAALCLNFLLLTGCGAYQYSDALWVPQDAPRWWGEDNEMGSIAARCNAGYYKGFSTDNLNAMLSTLCEPLKNGNKICAVESTDEYIYWTTESTYDHERKTWTTQQVKNTGYRTYMINTYINPKGLIYDCKAERGEYALFKKRPEPKLPLQCIVEE